MHIHCIQHVAFEGIGCIKEWAQLRNHVITTSALYESVVLPQVEVFDWLVVMGGPMGVHDEHLYPWLRIEKQLIEQAVQRGKTIVGICLGAQLIADVLGAKVYANKEKEIGWFSVQPTEQGETLGFFPEKQPHPIVFHWHGDTFDMPNGAVHLASSQACTHQAFLYNNNVLGLQFHLEVEKNAVDSMITHGRHELQPRNFVQTEEELRYGVVYANGCTTLLFTMLDRLAGNAMPTRIAP